MMMREILDNRRLAVTFTIPFWNQHWNVSVGFAARKPMEIFINAVKTPGTDLDTMCRDFAIVTSLALQHGCPLETIAHAISRTETGAPSGIAGAIMDVVMEI